jgi:hypothetical protein
MDERGRKFPERLASTAVPTVVEVVSPAVSLISEQFIQAASSARTARNALWRLWPRRRPVSKPCTWCSDRAKRPATHTVKWRELVVWWDEFDGTPTFWPAGRVMRMCEFHARIAKRYDGVKAYRFRRL